MRVRILSSPFELRSRLRLWAGVGGAFLFSAVVIALALTLPRLVDDQGVGVSLVSNSEFVAIRSDGVRREPSSEIVQAWTVEVDELARLEEPDVLDEWEEYKRFVAVLDGLNRRVSRSSQLELVRADGSTVAVHVVTASLAYLGWAFWLQIATGLFCALTGELTWRLARPSPGLLGYRLAGWGVGFAAWASALYATRSIGLSAELFEAAHAVNSIVGGPLFGAGLCMLLSSEPIRLMKRPSLWLFGIPVTAILWWGRFSGLGPSLSGYSAILFYTAAIAGLLTLQRVALREAVEHAIWRWFTLGVVCGIGFFVLAQAVPIALGKRPFASQTVTLVGFAWLFGLLSLGASRYRLFAVARYWGRTWRWLAVSSGFIVLDLIVVTRMPGEVSAHGWLVFVAMLWLYLLLRQMLAERLKGQKRGALFEGARQLSQATSEVDLLRRFEEELGRHFDTVDVDVAAAAADVYLARQGQDLVVPWPRGDAAFVLRHKDAGRSLFDQADADEARTHLEFARNLLEARDAYSRGEMDERQRVRRDLHDHLGARLSRLTLACDDANTAREIAGLTRELRQLTAALTGDPVSLEEMLLELESEARTVARVHQCPLEVTLSPALESLSAEVQARQRSDWIAFVRESLENAGRHAVKGGEVQLEISPARGGILLRITSIYDGGEPLLDGGRQARCGGFGLGAGLMNLKRRAQLSGGTFTAKISGDHFVTSLLSPLLLVTEERLQSGSSSVRRIATEARSTASDWREAR